MLPLKPAPPHKLSEHAGMVGGCLKQPVLLCEIHNRLMKFLRLIAVDHMIGRDLHHLLALHGRQWPVGDHLRHMRILSQNHEMLLFIFKRTPGIVRGIRQQKTPR